MNELQQLTQRIVDLHARRDGLVAQMTALTARYEHEDWTDGAQTRFDDLDRAITKVDDEVTPLVERRNALILGTSSRDAQRAELADRAARGEFHTATGDGARAAGEYADAFNFHRGINADEALSRANSLGGSVTPEGTAVLVESARRSIEGWTAIRSAVPAEYQERAEATLLAGEPRYRGAVAQHIVALSTREYDEAFNEFMVSGPNFVSSDARRTLLAGEMAANRERAMSESSVAAGQAMVPPFLDPTINLTNAGTINPFRQLADVRRVNTQTWRGVSTAGVSAEWTAEASESTDASPSDWAQPSITPVRADAYVQVSYELAADTSIVTDLTELFADARDRLEGTAFAVGSGSTQPFGVVTDLNLITASRVSSTTNGSFGAVDIFAMDSALDARWRPNASWVANPFVWNQVRQMGNTPSPYSSTFWTDFAGDVPSKLLGRPVYESSAMQGSISTATASSDDLVLLGDFRRGMKIIDRVGMSVGVINVVGNNKRPTGEWGYFAFWRVGSKVIVPQALKMLVV